MADTVTKLDAIVLEGHVRMRYHSGDAKAEIVADRVVIDMKDGSLAVTGAPKGTDPAAAKDQLFHFWIGMFQ